MDNTVFKITKWNGRLGNNIIQLINVIQLSLFYKYNICIPNHSFFDSKKINNYHENNTLMTDFNDFFYINKMRNIEKRAFDLNIIESKLLLKKYFKINHDLHLEENNLLIHLRGGDIFSNCPHKEYINPPLYYYKSIIDDNNYKNIVLISEDKKNPNVNKLLELYPNIKFKQQKLEEDIKLLLASENIIMSIGSFVPSLLLLSNNIKKLYKPSYQSLEFYEKFFNDIEIINIDLTDYRNKQYPWINSKKQRELLINYKK